MRKLAWLLLLLAGLAAGCLGPAVSPDVGSDGCGVEVVADLALVPECAVVGVEGPMLTWGGGGMQGLTQQVPGALDPAHAPPFVPPAPVFGYYEEGNWSDWSSSEELLPVFAQHGLTLFLGMRDADVGSPDLLHLLQEAEAQGVEVRAWILLPYEEGYWPGETNAEAFSQAALAYADWFAAQAAGVEWIVVDMETDIATTNTLAALGAAGDLGAVMDVLEGNLAPAQFDQASAIYRDMAEQLRARGFRVMVVTYPQVLDDLADGDTAIQDMLDIPVSTVEWDEVSTMVYTTTFNLFSGQSFGPYAVYDYAALTLAKYPATASIALGVSGEMQGPDELAAQVAAAKAAGVERIQVYSYGGSISHDNADTWHAAFQAFPAVPPVEPDVELLHQILAALDAAY